MTSRREVPATIVAISGSLRRSSINSAVLRAAAAAAARDGTRVGIDHSVRELPHFDLDLEIDPPEAVLRFRAACEEAAGVLLAVPEYSNTEAVMRLLAIRGSLRRRSWNNA